ncbi:hypothetical protein [Mycolicibacterium sp. SCSIO 43805]|uniref:hypothetical protein n=1 Tax=Mycolicibacterium sp. SCSIO 43805 TaxID=3378074 RepID=UPI003AB89C4F
MTTDHTDSTLDDTVSTATDILRRRIEEIERDRGHQPEFLEMAREEAEQARQEALKAEPWADCWNAIPTTDAETGEMIGMMSLPTIDGKELWGTRLAFDILDAGDDRSQIEEVLGRYFSALSGNTEHLFFVFSAALCTIAEHVVPAMLDKLEREASDYRSRILLADAAANAWRTRANDLRGHDDHAAGGQ